MQTKARQRLGAFFLRHGKVYEGKSRWTQAHWRWMETITFETAMQQIVLQEYIEAAKDLERRVLGMEGQIRLAMTGWNLEPVVKALMALRGVSLITAVATIAELGDLTRFDTPKELMAYLGLVPSEHSSGGSKRQSEITKTGNAHVRRMLVESAWNYRFAARKTRDIQKRAEQTSEPVQAIACEEPKRLCARYQKLINAGKVKQQVTTAVARELTGFICAIACEVSGKTHASKATQ